MPTLHFTDETIRRLQARAAQTGLAIETLLQRWLDTELPAAPVAQPDYPGFDSLPVSIVLCDATSPDLPIQYVNAAFEHETGYSRAEVMGRNPRFLRGTDQDQPGLDIIRRALADGTPCEALVRNYRKDGSLFWNEIRLVPLYDPQGSLRQVVAVQYDVTGRKQAETALRRSEELLIETGMVARVGGWDLDLETDTVYWTHTTRQIHEVPDDYLPTLSDAITFFHPDDQPVIAEAVRRARQEGIAYDLELRFFTRTGKPLWVHCIGMPEMRAGVCVRLHGTFQDITERRQAQEALLQSEARLRYLLNNTPAVIFTARSGGDYAATFASENVQKITGYPPEAFTSDPTFWASKLHPEDAPIVFELMATIPVTGYSSQQYRYLCADGSYKWMRAEVQMMRDSSGEPIELIGYWLDIHQQMQAEQALRQSEARLRSLIESQTAFVVRTDMEGNYTYANHAFLERFGWMYPQAESIIGQPSLPTIIPEDHEKTVDAVIACVQQPGVPVQVILRKPSRMHRTCWTLWEFVALTGADDALDEIQCIGVDITELMEIRQQAQLQESALLATADAIVITDRDAHIEWVNPAFTRLTGYSQEEARGKNPNSLVKSGVHSEEFYKAMWDTILAGRVWFGKLVNRRKNGLLYTEEQTITPVYNNLGEISHFIAIKRDITDRERNEQFLLAHERLKAQFSKEREQNALIQQTISALSHDLRTPLAIIATSRDILSRYFDSISSEQRREKLDSIEHQLQYALELLDDTVMVVKSNLNHRILRLTPVNLAILCQVSLNEIRDTSDKRQRFIFSNTADAAEVLIDEILVSRILLNLLSNAVKYSPEGSEIRLNLSQREHWIVLVVTDQGMGISAEDMPHIFEPFYRAAAVETIGGTGLGLSIVHDCVMRHQGHIMVESQPGRGTAFTVELPLKTAPGTSAG